MITEFNHVGILVSNMDKTVEFYSEYLGGKVINEALIPSSNTKCVYLQISGGTLEFLCRGNQADPSNVLGFSHLAFMVDNLDQTYEEFTSAGLDFAVKPKAAGTGRGRLAFLPDPNGVRLEIIERDDSFRRPKITEGKIRSFDHVSLTANNLEAAEKFYSNFAGFRPLKRMKIEERNLTMVYVINGDDVIEFLHRPTPQTDGNLIGHIALRVDDVHEMTEILKSKGVRFDPDSPKKAGTGLGSVSNFRDPDGVKIELVDRKDLREL